MTTIVVSGARGAGKSSLIEAAGLGPGDRCAGADGTRHCTWWLTPRAVFLETRSPRVPDAARRGWHDWLRDASRERGRAIDAIVHAIPVEVLLEQSDVEAREAAEGLRSLWFDAQRHSDAPASISLVATHIDRIEGFRETFVAHGDDGEVLGAPVDSEAGRGLQAAVRSALDAIVTAAHASVQPAMALSPELSAREAIFGFPLELSWLARRIHTFTAALATSRSAGLRVEGIYLTSALQDDWTRPCQVVAVMGRAFGLRGSLRERPERGPAPIPRSDSKPTFVRGTMDRILASASRR